MEVVCAKRHHGDPISKEGRAWKGASLAQQAKKFKLDPGGNQELIVGSARRSCSDQENWSQLGCLPHLLGTAPKLPGYTSR